MVQKAFGDVHETFNLFRSDLCSPHVHELLQHLKILLTYSLQEYERMRVWVLFQCFAEKVTAQAQNNFVDLYACNILRDQGDIGKVMVFV